MVANSLIVSDRIKFDVHDDSNKISNNFFRHWSSYWFEQIDIDGYNLLICNKLFFGMILNLQVHKNSKLIIIYINRIKIIN